MGIAYSFTVLRSLLSLLLPVLLLPLRQSNSLSPTTTSSTSYRNRSHKVPIGRRIKLLSRVGSSIVTTTTIMMSFRPIWTSLEPNTFENAITSSDGRRYAKDETYLEAVLSSWKKHWEGGREVEYVVQTSPWLYYDEDKTPLYGHIVRRRRTATPTTVSDRDDTDIDVPSPVPGVLLFHTAAGPHDVFLFQAAFRLVSSFDCIVLICDILSDPNGWAWTDRSRYVQVREDLCKDDYGLLKSRVEAAILALCPKTDPHGEDDSSLGVDRKRLAALGWCLGGQPILELTRMTTTNATNGSFLGSIPGCHVRAMVSFHGVYHRDGANNDFGTPLHPPTENQPRHDEEEGHHQRNTSDNNVRKPEVLICNGQDDPFVSVDDLEITKVMMTRNGYKVSIVQYDGAKHGFTNPAQAYNENDAFGYNEVAATESWTSTMALLRRQLLY